MSEIVRTIVVMSVSGSIIALLLFAIKPLIKSRISKSAQYYLWLVVIVALIVPVSRFVVLPDSGSAHIPVAPIQSVVQQRVITLAEEAQRLSPGYSTSGDKNLDSWERPAQTEQQRGYTTFVTVFIYTYPFSATAILLYHLIAYSVYIRKLHRKNKKANADCAIPVYRNAKAATPMLIGLFNPVIILPDCEYTDEQLNAILRHEIAHLRRKDILVKWLSVLACSIHWFNPIVWLSRREIDQMCELACDETVLRGLDTGGKQCYGETLIFVAAENKTPRTIVSTTMCEEKKNLMGRLDAIRKSKKYTRIATALSVLLIAAAMLAACVLGASAQKAQEDNTQPVAVAPGSFEDSGTEKSQESIAIPTAATPDSNEEAGKTEFSDKTAVEYKWAIASSEIRRQLIEPAYFEADRLCYVKSVDGADLEVYTIYRNDNESGGFLPYVMFSSDNDPIHAVSITADAQIELLYIRQDSPDSESMAGSPADIVPGSVISAWGDFSESEWVFIANHIVIWTIVGDVSIPTEYQNQLFS